MLTFDRIVLTMLALGIWALVLTPQELGAHDDNGHSCDVKPDGLPTSPQAQQQQKDVTNRILAA